MARIAQDRLEQRVYDYAWHYVNTCGGSKAAAYRKALSDDASPAGEWGAYHFYRDHKEEIDALIKKFREENRAQYPHMRDANIAILKDIAANGTRNADRISAIKELDNIFGYNEHNVSINGKVDSEIEITINNL